MQEVSVIVVTRNRAKDLDRCLKSLTTQDYPNFEVIVVDGHSIDNTYELAKKYRAKIIQQDGIGRCNARNCGLKVASGEIVAFLDDDCRAHPSWISELVACYASGVAGVGGKPMPFNPKFQDNPPIKFGRIVGGLVDRSKEDIGKIHASGWATANFEKGFRICEVDHMPGCNMSFRNSLLSRVGFDENYTGTCFREETDPCVALKLHGYKFIYNPNAIVYHHQSQKTRTQMVYFSYYERINEIYFVCKNRLITSLAGVCNFLMAQAFCSLAGVYRSLKYRDRRYLLAIRGILEGFYRVNVLLKRGLTKEVSIIVKKDNMRIYNKGIGKLTTDPSICDFVEHEFHCKLPSQSIVSDVGCGFGIDLASLNCSNKIGLDISRRNLDKAKHISTDINLVNGDAENLPFRNEIFDATLAISLLHHLPFYKKALAEIHRVLKPQGYFLLKDTNLNGFFPVYPFIRIAHSLSAHALGSRAENIPKRLDCIQAVLNETGFSVIDTQISGSFVRGLLFYLPLPLRNRIQDSFYKPLCILDTFMCTILPRKFRVWFNLIARKQIRQ